MKSNWNYPTSMWVGKDRIKDLSNACKILNINKPLLVTDNGLAKSKIVIDALNNLKEHGILVELYSDVVGNPTVSNVTEGADYYNKNNCDGVIAFGGGSGLDVGKAIAFMSGQTLPIWDFEDVGDNWTIVQLSPTSSKSHIGNVWPDINAIALPTSRPLPPPKAITPSQLFLL